MNKQLVAPPKQLYLLTEIAIALLLLHNVPYIGNHTPASVFGLLVIIVYILLIAESRKGLYASLFSCLTIISVLILGFLADSFFAGQILIKNAYGLLQVFLYPYIGGLILKYDLGKTVTRLFWLVLLSYFITSISTYYGCQIVPGASRILASSTMLDNSGMKEMINSLNIAGFSEIYVIALLSPLIVMMIRRKTIHFLIGASILIGFGFGIIASEYTGALFVYVMSLFLFFLPKNYSHRKYFVTLIILLIVGLFGYLLIADFLSFLAKRVESISVSERLSDLSSVLSGNQANVDTNSDIMTRRENYDKSWETFVVHPFGGWKQELTGGHSFVLDSLARFGILGFVLLIIMYTQIFRRFVSRFKNSPDFGYGIVSFLLVLFLAMINPDPHIMFICFVFPLFFKYSENRI